MIARCGTTADAADTVDVGRDAGVEVSVRGGGHVQAAYGPNHQRLVALKDRYDPTNLFRLNVNLSSSERQDGAS